MKCIVKACPLDGIRPITIALPKGAYLGRHEILAQEFKAEVKMCLRHHRMFTAPGIESLSIREQEEA